MIPRALEDRIREFCRQPVIIVACDYDGTLSPIIDDPSLAYPVRESAVALRSLAEMHSTNAAVISGRSLRDLAALSRLPVEVHLIGSHGSEFDVGFHASLPPDVVDRRRRMIASLESLASRFAGATLELKPAGVAFHVRGVDPPDRRAALDRAVDVAAPFHPFVRYGKCVIEFALVETNKGRALTTLRERLDADAAIFIGDDQTDEDAFAVLSGPDVAVKVGSGPTMASFRLDDTLAVSQLLAMMVMYRSDWLNGGDAPLLQELSPLANGSAVALIDDRGSLCWLCHPRPDSPSVFASLIGGDAAGYWRVVPIDGRNVRDQRFLGDTMSLETTWHGVVVTDTLLAPSESLAATRMLRRVATSIPVRVEFAPRGDFGRARTSWALTDDGLVANCGHTTLTLRSPGVEWRIETGTHGGVASAEIHPVARHEVELDLLISEHALVDVDLGEPGERRAETDREWSTWAAALNTDDPLVRRSALVLRALCYQPSGAILAAATTSLPESIGGTRNWDYRFCWPRDAAYIGDALLRLGSATEAHGFLRWMCGRLEGMTSAATLRPVYPLEGSEYLPEAVIPTLPGYRGSRPVRVGNLAEHQFQLDVFGPVVELIESLQRHDGALDVQHVELMRLIIAGIAERWSEPDHGIWEQRRAPRHYVHSKAMCWMGVDRGIRVVERVGESAPDDWYELRGAIRDDIVRRGWSDAAGSFTSAYGDDDLDASLLQLATCGIFDPADPRVEATVLAVQDALQDGVLVYRYRHDDGLPGSEGGFLVCTAWLIEALHAIGRHRDAAVLYRRFAALAGSTGTFTEQHDPHLGVALGNAPQGYSHAGLIRSWDAVHNLNLSVRDRPLEER